MTPGMFARIALIGGALLVMASEAPPPPDKYTPGNVIVAFEGGIVGEDMGSVMLALAKGDLVPVKSHVIAKGETICSVLATNGFPSDCSKSMLQALDLLNPTGRLTTRSLAIGQSIVVPDVAVRRYRGVKTFATILPNEQARSKSIKGNWKSLSANANIEQSTRRFEKVEFDAFEMIFAAGTSDRQARIMALLEPKRSPNLRVDAIGFAPIPVKSYQISAAVYPDGCKGITRHPPKVNYRSYADSDGDLAALVANRPPGSVSAKVYIVDVALDPGPNLADATETPIVADPTQWNCVWAPTPSASHHATHMAGIIASRDNGFGFVGLSPSSQIGSFKFLETDPNDPQVLQIPPGNIFGLADAIRLNREDGVPSLYLVATDFPGFSDIDLPGGQLPGVAARFNGRPIERILDQVEPLVVVAAGQGSARANDRPIGLSPMVPRSPQNLGDKRYVLVVTACDNCSRKSPTILADANYGSDNGRYVHVAAPGGQPVVGWVSKSEIGAAAGTSQAAAYTAGVIAEMIGRWPRTYVDPDIVKKRIQITSWPIWNRPGLPSDDWKKLATGLVDPLLAMVDPKQHWIKRAGSWAPIRLKGIAGSFTAVDGSTTVPLNERNLARIVKVSGDSGSPKWVIYRDAAILGEPGAELGEVKRDGPLTPDASAVLTPCDGGPIPLGQVEDLVIASRGFGATPC